MPKLGDVASHVRSKVAGPFWVTIDVFFPDRDSYARWHDNPALRRESVAKIYEVASDTVSIYPVEKLNMVKISYPRATPQGGVTERDLHSGQQFAYLLEVEMA
ncbi:DUF4387 domain-containing protein [Sphingomonas oligophenolica]|uniref:DUF4387 domain-containing protein n=1 Tax=Sphingomonas oligophenolica TaxID=301154 RepID=A0ABU9Y672_9SPHN